MAFVEAAALGSFSAAARKLNKSQPTISIAIANLEADVGCQLFDRSGRHPLAALAQVTPGQLKGERQLFIRPYARSSEPASSQAWSAPDYLTLMEFAGRGFGWAELPKVIVERFGKDLVELQVRGYPRSVDIDVAWSRKAPLGVAGQWLLGQVLEG